ncbi:MAG: iron complex transport system substrate-binding protein [Cellvibrionaceae bacterium]|jgi:iron complex transport system substrate-binding protein
MSLTLDVGSSTLDNGHLQVIDYSGRTIRLGEPAKRIIALAPHIVENIYRIGAGDSIVGTVNYADYPEAARGILRVGNIQSVSVEAIIALRPDLIVAWSSSLSPKIAQQFSRLGLPVYMDEPQVLSDVAKSIRDMGILTGNADSSEVIASDFLTRLSLLEKRYRDRDTVSVLYQIWNTPLQTISEQHIISDVIRLCGGRNSFADAAVIAPKISIESVLRRDPDVIIASGVGDKRPDWLEDWKSWTQLTAVKNHHLFFVPADLLQRHTVRLLLGAEDLCEQLERARKNLQ